MGRQKRLQDLTIKDNFMFGAVMSIEENCIAFLEMVLGFPIEKVVVSKERSMIYHPEYRGVRLDIYARDENHTHYNVEMQARRQADLAESEEDFDDELVRQFQTSIREIKTSREMGERYMLFEELLKEERQEGIAEGLAEGLAQGRQETAREYILEVLADKGEVPAALKEALCEVDSEEELKRLFKLAAKVESTEAFQKIVEETVNKLKSREA